MTDPSTHTDSAYDSLAAAHDDARWAYGTGFDDPLAGVDTTLPDDVDGAALGAYCLMLADDALVMSQRLAEWSTNAPELEEEVALANIGLDLLGQARLLLARAAAADPACVPTLPGGSPVPAEDALAYFRDESEFRNVRLAEVANGDFAASTARLFCFTAWRLSVITRLRDSHDPVLAAVAAKGVKELAYHRDYAARWFVTLAQGTAESRRRMTAGLAGCWPYVGELFDTHDVESSLTRVAVDPATVREEVDDTLGSVLAAAALDVPDIPFARPAGERGGRDGVHTEAMSQLLSEMQVVARAHPMGSW